MKKLTFVLIAAAVVLSTVATSANTAPDTAAPQPSAALTHAVFAEEMTTSWCPNCPTAAEALYDIYSSHVYPFYFVAFVADQNPIAAKRFSLFYRGQAIPTVFFDGGYLQPVGSGTLSQAIATYTAAIEETGARTVHGINVSTEVTSSGGAAFDIVVSVTNTESRPYLGILTSYVTEITSRWKNDAGDPYHFGFLDYAVNKIIFVPGGKTKQVSVTFDGAATHGNLTFPDLTADNVMVFSSVSHIRPHLIEKVEYIGTHIAFYVDQCDAAAVR
jgi:thiol-disulfide isomerase/thioredoxin